LRIAHAFAALGVLFVVAPLHARAATTVGVRATVADNLQAVHGQVVVRGDDVHLAMPLPELPIPEDDVLSRRTFPQAPQQGLAHLGPATDSIASFSTVMPRRYGASGMVPGRGLFANGIWHPQPMEGGELAVVHWVVEVTLPEGTIGVLNGKVGQGRLTWVGEADRLSLAVIPNGRATELDLEVGTVTLVERGPKRKKRQERLTQAVLDVWQGPGAPQLVVVDTPSRRRLVRTGPQVLYLSDRAFRVSAGLWKFHRQSVQKGILEAGLPLVDPWERDIAAAALALEVAPEGDVREALGWASWIPEIDALLYDGRLPFYSDVFTEIWPGDPVADDLGEVLDPTTPGAAICARLDERHGDGTCARLAWELIGGSSLEEAAEATDLDATVLRQWRRWPAAQSLVLDVDEEAGLATLTRATALAAESGRTSSTHGLAAEPVVLAIGDQERVWEAPAGPGQLQLPLPPDVDRVQADPHGALLQDTRTDDRWPTRWVPTVAFFPTELALTNRRISAFASIYLREQYNTRWLFMGTASTDPINLVAADAGAFYSFGPLQDRRSRPYDVWFGVGPALLDPRFRPVEGNGLALGAWAGAAWDTTVDPIFPRSGHRLRVSGRGGFVPGTSLGWSGIGASASKVQGIGGRVAGIARVSGDLATGDVLHRLVPLGGGSALQAVTPQAVVGERRALLKSELRWQAIRFASVPGPLVWLSDVQLSGGFEAGALGADGASCPQAEASCAWRATGWTAGLLFTGDVAGVRPTHLGATVARPLTWSHEALAPGNVPQIYVRLTQSM